MIYIRFPDLGDDRHDESIFLLHRKKNKIRAPEKIATKGSAFILL